VDMGVGPAPMEYHCYPAWTSESVCLLPDSGIYRPQNCAAGSEEPVWLVIALGLLGAALLSRRRSRI
jgi:MYXO-CTERM domain-containing protein